MLVGAPGYDSEDGEQQEAPAGFVRGTIQDLEQGLHGLERKGYPVRPSMSHKAPMSLPSNFRITAILLQAYRDVKGAWSMLDGNVLLCIDHIQADPYASPSRFRVKARQLYVQEFLPA